jgi:acylphosphatase
VSTTSDPRPRSDAAGEGLIRRRIVVSGRVQGVGYRVSCAREAMRVGVAGTVRNLIDGRVEVVAIAPLPALELLTSWCRRGPWAAEVLHVVFSDDPLDDGDGTSGGFRIV